MKAEVIVELPQELVNQIADRVIERLSPLIKNYGRVDDTIFDVQGLADYLKISKKWIYERTQFKEIPYVKVKGLLRFRKKDIDKWLDSYNVPAVNTDKRILKAIK